MALWQISFYVIPKSFLDKSHFLDRDEDGLFDDSVYWSGNYTLSFFDVIEDFLPKGKSWSGDIMMFGIQESNLFEVLTEGSKILSVSFRIDFTSDYEEILRSVIEFCLMNNLIIITTDLEVLPLNFEVLDRCIKKSPQVIRYNELF